MVGTSWTSRRGFARAWGLAALVLALGCAIGLLLSGRVERRAARQYNAGHRLARRQCGERSREALLSGIAQGDRSGVRSALEQGADPNATGSQDEEGRYQPRNAGAL